jgi:membrane-bound lytic murein transglycosylase MltF
MPWNRAGEWRTHSPIPTHRSILIAFMSLSGLSLFGSGCSGEASGDGSGEGPAAAAGAAAEESADDLITALDEQTAELKFVLQPWHGDLDGIRAERFGLIRLLTVLEPMHYSVDGRKQGGATYEGAREFEKFLNQRLGITRREDRVHVVIVPVRRDELIPFVRDGRGDIAAANLTVTDERLREVDFSRPFADDAYEIVVTGPGGEPIETVRDLAGREVFVRASSSYRQSLERISDELAADGLPGIEIVGLPELLDDGAILELVDDGDIPATVVDAHVATFWAQQFANLRLHDDVRTRENARIAFAVQKNAPELRSQLDAFVATHGKGTLLGNMMIRRYYEDTRWLETVSRYETERRLDDYLSIFQASAERYDLDWRRLAAQAWQESGFDQNRRSSRGAIGLMQLMPATAREMGFADVTSAEANIEAGAKYMRHVIDTYFSEVEQNRGLDPESAHEQAYALALAAYNAGPSRISQLQRQAASRGRDPSRWFKGVDGLVSREVGREPVDYVDNVFQYSVKIQMMERLRLQRRELEESGALPGR